MFLLVPCLFNDWELTVGSKNREHFSSFRPLAFTLLELLIVLAVISVLAAVMIPAIQAVRESSRLISCCNNLRQLGIAIQSYESSMGCLPPGTIGYAEVVDWNDYRNLPDGISWKNKQQTSFLAILLPYSGFEDVARVCDSEFFDTGKDLRSHRLSGTSSADWFAEIGGFEELSATRVNIHLCPSDKGAAEHFIGGSQPVMKEGEGAFSFLRFLDTEKPGTYVGANYLGCAGATTPTSDAFSDANRFRGVMSSGRQVRLSEIGDGISNTVALGESIGEIFGGDRKSIQAWSVGGLGRGRGKVAWEIAGESQLLGDKNDASGFGFGSFHHAGVNFLLVDGSVRTVGRGINGEVVFELCGKRDGGVK